MQKAIKIAEWIVRVLTAILAAIAASGVSEYSSNNLEL
jgi:hypothetical protein